MKNWFNFKPSYDTTLESGIIKKVTEHYLIDALSFTEAEARGIQELKPFVNGDFAVQNITRANISEIFFNEKGDKFFKGKLKFITLDEKTGAEKATSITVLAQASDFDEAIGVIKQGMKGSMTDWRLASLVETEIIEVFTYSFENKKGGE